LIVTHAHIDHVGLVPKLVAKGFDAPVFSTAATKDLMGFMLPDSAKIQESDAERRNRKNLREGKAKVTPAYTTDHARAALRLVKTRAYGNWFSPGPGVRARFWNAGHILGSASVELEIGDGGAAERPLRMLFSGDLGPDEKMFHPDPDAPAGFDYILCESTYGGVNRPDVTLEERSANLGREIRMAMERGGNLIIPAFAVERSQELLHDIGLLMNRREIPDVPVYLDSPLARKVTSVFVKHAEALDDVDAKKLFKHPQFKIVQSVAQSKQIKEVEGGAIILSASGMCDAGRIKHHLRNNLWRSDATLLFVGYQAPGTLGHILRGGAKLVRIHGKTVEVNAVIREIGNYSAHADGNELIAWARERLPATGGVFLTHGEQARRKDMREELIRSGLPPERVILPALDETFTLAVAETIREAPGVARIAPAELERDWYNDYAALILELGHRLEEITEASERRVLLARLRDALEETEPS
jgi:metallo-beta-lactamase family protein